MRIAVFGTGGVGGYFGGRLAQAGEDVTFIARGKHLHAIQQHGLRVKSFEGDFTVTPAQATDDPRQIGAVDLILVGVKAWQVPEAAEAMPPLLGPETVVLPLQNGVEAPRQLVAVLGPKHVLGGLCRIISYISTPGEITHAGIQPYVAFGELDRQRSERVNVLCERLSRAQGMIVEVAPDIQLAMWRKFLLISAWSGVGAVTRAPMGVMRSQPETRAMLVQAMEEIVGVAQGLGIELPASTIADSMTFFDGLPPTGTASMQRDIIAGRPSELEAQNGAVVRLGREAGRETPLHTFIYHSLLPLERRARGELDFSL